mgnify:FL=1
MRIIDFIKNGKFINTDVDDYVYFRSGVSCFLMFVSNISDTSSRVCDALDGEETRVGSISSIISTSNYYPFFIGMDLIKAVIFDNINRNWIGVDIADILNEDETYNILKYGKIITKNIEDGIR